jgi:RNA polymerase primary sigma factor
MPSSDIIRKAIELGRQRGFVTFGELNELLPSTTAAPEDIEALLAALSDEGINLVEDDGP